MVRKKSPWTEPDCYKLNIKTLTVDATPEPSDLLLHAAFQVLTDYMEQVEPKANIDWNWNKLLQEAHAEMVTLYKWWKEKRPARTPLPELTEDDEDVLTQMDSYQEEDEDALSRLVFIMSFLWV